MAQVTFVVPNCIGAVSGYGVTLNVFGSDMDASRMVIFDPFGVKVPFDILTLPTIPSPIYLSVGMKSGAPGFLNGNYFIGFSPYETETYTVIVACPLPDYSGLFIINQDISRRDTYIRAQNKIPDPTVRTALLGE